MTEHFIAMHVGRTTRQAPCDVRAAWPVRAGTASRRPTRAAVACGGIALVALAGCGATSLDPGPEVPPSGIARVTGRVVSRTGAPLDAVVVGVVATGDAGSLSGVSVPTQADGRFDVLVKQYAVVAPSAVDTQRVHVRAYTLAPRYPARADGTPAARDSVVVPLLIVRPPGPPPAVQVTITLPID